MKRFKRIVSMIMVGVMGIMATQSVFAEGNSYVSEIQGLVDEAGIEATVEEVSSAERNMIWRDSISKKDGTVELQEKLKADGFTKSQGDIAIKVTDEMDKDLAGYYYFQLFENQDEHILAMYIYTPNTPEFFHVYSQKIGANDKAEEYYSKISEGPSVMTRSFNWQSFLCGLTETIACGAFSAMLFAFIPASIAVGMSCGAAFAYVCSYA